jgi:parallel beta-helix repeat protein
MKSKSLFTYLFAVFAICTSIHADAVSCGDVITSNTTLTADLYCNSGYTALEIAADNITLDLNGHTLSGTRDLVGISVYGKNKVQIKGNGGGLKGFWAGINSNESNQLRVNGTTFYDLDAGVIISAGSEGLVENNDFIYMGGQGVFIANFIAGKQANNNTVTNNEFYQSNTGIYICGDDSDKNILTKNLIWLSQDRGIHLVRSDHNILQDNEVIESGETAIRLDDSARNQIKSNSLKKGRVGLEILAGSSGACLETGLQRSFKNVYQGNHTFEFETAVIMGTGVTSNSVYSNLLNGNKLYDNNTGIFFNTDTYLNNATSNAYTGTITPVVDLGVRNSY